jgi:hypothetical protein
MGQENVYFGTEPLKPRTQILVPQGKRRKMGAPRKASTNQTRSPWMATMTKGDHMAAVLHTGTPQGVRGPARGKR